MASKDSIVGSTSGQSTNPFTPQVVGSTPITQFPAPITQFPVKLKRPIGNSWTFDEVRREWLNGRGETVPEEANRIGRAGIQK